VQTPALSEALGQQLESDWLEDVTTGRGAFPPIRHSGDLPHAIENYSAAIAINPVYALAYNNRSHAHEAQGHREDAIIATSRRRFFSIRRQHSQHHRPCRRA